MNDQAKAARREYQRRWAKANKDKVKASQERYWERRAAAAAQADKEKTTDQSGGR